MKKIGGQSKANRKKPLVLIFVLIVLIGLGAGGTYLLLSKGDSAGNDVGEMNPTTSALVKEKLSISDSSKNISSTLGFSINYDGSLFDATGQVTDPASDSNGYVFGTEYSNDELDESREYSIVNIFPKEEESEEEEESLASMYKPELTVLTNIRKAYWDNRVNKPEHAGKDKLQIFIDEVTSDQRRDSANNELNVSEIEKVTVNDVELSKVTYTVTNRNYGYDYKYQTIYYFAVNNDRPYYLSISNVQNDPGGLIKTYESFIASLKFGDVDDTKLAQTQSSLSNVLSATTEELPEDTTNTVDELDPKTLINVVAKNQIAVVRVGTVNCMNLDLKIRDETVSALGDVCNAGIGSGSIISSDGYVATNGHVAQIGPKGVLAGHLLLAQSVEELADRAKDFESYLVGSGQVSSAGFNSLINAILANDTEAINAAYGLAEIVEYDDIKVNNEESNYSIQLSNEPIKMNIDGDKISFEQTNNLVSAKFIDADYDRNTSTSRVDISSMSTSDVAVLKMETAEFPSVALGSISNIRSGDQLTALGFPAFLDDGLLTKQKNTIPSATQGSVRDVMQQSQEHPFNLLVTDVPIAQGNSGGPAFDDLGFQVGLNTYSSIECADMKCFGNGTARDVQDLKNLLQSNSIQLRTKTVITDDWNEGLKAFSNGKYKVATTKFNSVASKYRDNYLAKEMSGLSSSLIGSETDTSSNSVISASPKTISMIIIPIIILAIGAFVFVKLKKKNQMQPATYNQYPQNAYQQSQTLPPVQQFNQPQPNQQQYQPNQYPQQAQPQQFQPQAQPQQYQPQQQVVQPQQPVSPSFPSQPNNGQQIITPSYQNPNQPQVIRPNDPNQRF